MWVHFSLLRKLNYCVCLSLGPCCFPLQSHSHRHVQHGPQPLPSGHTNLLAGDWELWVDLPTNVNKYSKEDGQTSNIQDKSRVKRVFCIYSYNYHEIQVKVSSWPPFWPIERHLKNCLDFRLFSWFPEYGFQTLWPFFLVFHFYIRNININSADSSSFHFHSGHYRILPLAPSSGQNVKFAHQISLKSQMYYAVA